MDAIGRIHAAYGRQDPPIVGGVETIPKLEQTLGYLLVRVGYLCRSHRTRLPIIMDAIVAATSMQVRNKRLATSSVDIKVRRGAANTHTI